MRAALIALASLALAAAAAATPIWKEPGWYQVADTNGGPILWAGPFADEAACRATLPANEDDADYDCEYHAERPKWDD